jgi:hypothetical protein
MFNAKSSSFLASHANPEALHCFLSLNQWLIDSETLLLPFHSVEQQHHSESRELQRLLLQAHLDSRGHGDAGPAVSVNGTLFTHRRLHTRTIRTLAGEVQITRLAYSCDGHDSIHPLDEALQLPARSFSYDLQKHLVKAAVQGPFQESLARLFDVAGFQVYKRSLEDIIHEAAVDFDDYYLQRQPAPAGPMSTLLVVSVDGKGIPILQPAPSRRSVQPATKGPKPGTKKMATVAAVFYRAPWIRTPQQVVNNLFRSTNSTTYTDPPPRPEQKRIWASLNKGKAVVLDEVFQEVRRRDPHSLKTLVAITDGEKALQNLVRKKRKSLKVTLILDFLHAMTYVWEVAHALSADDSLQAEVNARNLCARLLDGEVCQVIKGLRHSATSGRDLLSSERKALRKAASYFDNNKHYMRYHEYLALGLPIASGPVEGACKNLIKDRMERSGMRWTHAMAETIVRLRAIYLSGDLDSYWSFHIAQEQARLYPKDRWKPVVAK